MFRLAGAELGVRSCACEGELGTYEAHLSDRGVLGYYLVHHNWEPGIQRLLSMLAKPGLGTFIDVGANVGMTLIPLRRDHPQLCAIGIEADDENFGYLQRNIERNGVANTAILYHCAMHFQDGEVEFERSGENAGDHRIRHGVGGDEHDCYGESGREVVRVRSARLDSLIDPRTLALPIGMKCDIQGAEVYFLRGSECVLASTHWVVIEYWPYGIRRAGAQPEEFFSLLSRHFPYGGIIDPESGTQPTLVPVEELVVAVEARLRCESTTAHCELLFVKADVAEQFGGP